MTRKDTTDVSYQACRREYRVLNPRHPSYELKRLLTVVGRRKVDVLFVDTTHNKKIDARVRFVLACLSVVV